MPVYKYQCRFCKSIFNYHLQDSHLNLFKCIKCNKIDSKPLIKTSKIEEKIDAKPSKMSNKIENIPINMPQKENQTIKSQLPNKTSSDFASHIKCSKCLNTINISNNDMAYCEKCKYYFRISAVNNNKEIKYDSQSMKNNSSENLLNKVKGTLKKEILSIEKRTDISDDEKVSRIIKIFSTTCAAIAVQPIPFADIFVLTPIQAFMGTRIGAIRGLKVSEAKATDIVKEIAGVVGLGLLAQQLVIGAYKTFIPFLGAITTIPIVYGMTYAIGKVIDTYFVKKKKNQKFNPEELKKIWEETLKQKKAEGKEKRKDIWDSRKEYEA